MKIVLYFAFVILIVILLLFIVPKRDLAFSEIEGRWRLDKQRTWALVQSEMKGCAGFDVLENHYANNKSDSLYLEFSDGYGSMYSCGVQLSPKCKLKKRNLFFSMSSSEIYILNQSTLKIVSPLTDDLVITEFWVKDTKLDTSERLGTRPDSKTDTHDALERSNLNTERKTDAP